MKTKIAVIGCLCLASLFLPTAFGDKESHQHSDADWSLEVAGLENEFNPVTVVGDWELDHSHEEEFHDTDDDLPHLDSDFEVETHGLEFDWHPDHDLNRKHDVVVDVMVDTRDPRALRKTIEAEFDLIQKTQLGQVKALHSRIATIEKRIKERAQKREAIIERRLKRLLQSKNLRTPRAARENIDVEVEISKDVQLEIKQLNHTDEQIDRLKHLILELQTKARVLESLARDNDVDPHALEDLFETDPRYAALSQQIYEYKDYFESMKSGLRSGSPQLQQYRKEIERLAAKRQSLAKDLRPRMIARLKAKEGTSPAALKQERLLLETQLEILHKRLEVLEKAKQTRVEELDAWSGRESAMAALQSELQNTKAELRKAQARLKEDSRRAGRLQEQDKQSHADKDENEDFEENEQVSDEDEEFFGGYNRWKRSVSKLRDQFARVATEHGNLHAPELRPIHEKVLAAQDKMLKLRQAGAKSQLLQQEYEEALAANEKIPGVVVVTTSELRRMKQAADEAKMQLRHLERELQWHGAVAMVVLSGNANARESWLIPIDRDGVLLPSEGFSPENAVNYPRISVGQTEPAGPAGTKWGDPSVEDAAEIAALLMDHWHELREVVYEIKAEENGGAPGQEFVILTQKDLGPGPNPTAHWGRAPGKEVDDEPTPEEKLHRLLEWSRNLKEGFEEAPKHVDLR